ncbi:HalOD1 output domain-containing protein [Halorussus caseinilyticus]|uniref:HalOD1 output domain-containing protein n=1 Tax=Halorussus caseinilyticus TaxID=3034025 RepID=A0ABD5WKU3_9EURY|nr:HalOD1 output domain-containing protein [Halorussus sp. DT72]
MTYSKDRLGASKEFRYQATADSTPAEAIVAAVTASGGASAFDGPEDVTRLPPLYDSVDTDALNAIFDSSWGERNADVSVTFDYSGYAVSVDSTGAVELTHGR